MSVTKEIKFNTDIIVSSPLAFPLVLLSLTIVLLSSSALLVNYIFFKYPGNSYFPDHMPVLCLIIGLIYLGLNLTYESGSKIRCRVTELLYFFGVMSLIALATEAVQFTPFTPIDSYLLKVEAFYHVDMNSILAWTTAHARFKYLLACIYDGLVYQMTFLPLILIILGRLSTVREYYFLMLLTVIIGFIFYYFFPTTAPASVINNPLFYSSQLATGIKFNQIHNYIIPTTIDGGLIALPSYHVIWAILSVYTLKEWPILCVSLGLVNLLLIASCVLLGWHYAIDVMGGLLVVGLSFCALQRVKKSKADG